MRARQDVKSKGFSKATRDALFHAAHDIKGEAATFGYPFVAASADSLCRLIEHTPDMNRIPIALVDQHVDAVRAIIRENARPDVAQIAERPDQAAARGHRRVPGAGEQGPAGRPGRHPGAVDRSDRTSF